MRKIDNFMNELLIKENYFNIYFFLKEKLIWVPRREV